MTDEDPMIAALLRERDGYVQRGMEERVAQVDEQLSLRGHAPEQLPASSTPPKGRRAARKDTT